MLIYSFFNIGFFTVAAIDATHFKWEYKKHFWYASVCYHHMFFFSEQLSDATLNQIICYLFTIQDWPLFLNGNIYIYISSAYVSIQNTNCMPIMYFGLTENV